METTQELALRFREVFLNGTWIANTNFQDQLTQIDWEQAISKKMAKNSIADLAQHIHYYIQGVLNVLKGGSLDIKDQFSFDFPPITSPSEWNFFLQTFWQDAENFALAIEDMPEDKLNHIFVKEQYGTYHRNINAIIEHGYYHLGQIVFIHKIETKN